ncbi:MAG: hypothetical protein K0U52_12800 [Gammaproteobacteria bacterium]|nr:hypothetical protein [Gammaproteobacteria bacterium]
MASPVASRVLVALSAVVLGVLISLVLIVPLLRNSCVWFTRRCLKIEYWTKPGSSELLIVDHRKGNSYWFDGAFIHAYGASLAGNCPTLSSIGATGEMVPKGKSIHQCTRVTPDGQCATWSAAPYVPSEMSGKVLGRGPLFEPAFVINAYTMALVPQQIWCSRSLGLVQDDFSQVGSRNSMTYHLPSKQGDANVYDLFAMLEHRGVFVRPSTNPEPDVCSGHGTLDNQTGVCQCDEGWVGHNCSLRPCKKGECGTGVCNVATGLCVCPLNRAGSSCEGYQCPGNCNGNGTCDIKTGKCVCNPGFSGDNCLTLECNPPCVVNQGTCNTRTGLCDCVKGWWGPTCADKVCPNDCSGNGTCDGSTGQCACGSNWTGQDCSVPK